MSLDLQVRDITTTEILVKREQGMFRMIGVTVGLVMLSVIVLSAAGIYSLMSFTVARRRREIGIRAALGADRHRLLLGIFSRASDNWRPVRPWACSARLASNNCSRARCSRAAAP